MDRSPFARALARALALSPVFVALALAAASTLSAAAEPAAPGTEGAPPRAPETGRAPEPEPGRAPEPWHAALRDARPAAARPSGPDQGGWTGITLEGASCGRGAPFRYYLSRSSDPEAGLVIWLSGGGVCVREGPPPEGATGPARELHCMTFSNYTDGFLNDLTVNLVGVMPFLDRANAASPFRTWHFAVIPYCTGDVHAGRMTAPHDYDPSPEGSFPVTHRGHLNVVAVLDDLAARLPGRDMPVLLTGASAGGFGAIYNFPEVVRRWPRTALIPDAGIAPMHPASLLVREGPAVAARWDAAALLPPYCREPRCLQDTLHLLAAHARHHDGASAPWLPFGFLQGQQDATLRAFLEMTACGYQVGLRGGLGATRTSPNLRAWVPATDQHVFGPSRAAATRSGVPWSDWFARVATAAGPEALPDDAVDAWLPCPTIGLPFLALGR